MGQPRTARLTETMYFRLPKELREKIDRVHDAELQRQRVERPHETPRTITETVRMMLEGGARMYLEPDLLVDDLRREANARKFKPSARARTRASRL